MILRACLLLAACAAPACAYVGPSTNVTQYPSSDHALGDLEAAAVKDGCTTEKTTLSGLPAVRVTCAEGAVTFFREQNTVRVSMGDKIIAECGDTPRPACDTVTKRIMDTAQGVAAPPAATSAAPSAAPSPAPSAAPSPAPSAAPSASH